MAEIARHLPFPHLSNRIKFGYGRSRSNSQLFPQLYRLQRLLAAQPFSLETFPHNFIKERLQRIYELQVQLKNNIFQY